MAYVRKQKTFIRLFGTVKKLTDLILLKKQKRNKKEYEMAFHSSVSIRKGREVLE